MRRSGALGVGLVGLMLWSGTSVMGQRSGGNRPGGSAPAPDPMTGLPPTTQGTSLPMGADDAVRERTNKIAMEQEKARNDDRQKRLVADTQRLLSLATELKEDVDKTSKDTLSVDVVKKADEIEKLAHSVKEKMKGS